MKALSFFFVACLVLVVAFIQSGYKRVESEDTNINVSTSVVMSTEKTAVTFQDDTVFVNVETTSTTSTTESTIGELYTSYNSDEWIAKSLNSRPEFTSDMKDLQPLNEEPMILSYDESNYYVPINQWYYDKYSLYQDEVLDGGSRILSTVPGLDYREFDLAYFEERSYILPPVISKGTTEQFEYLVHKNNKVQLIKYIGNSVNVTVPDEIDGKEVAYLGEYLFADSNIKSVKLGNNIETIGNDAFSMCKQLSEVVLNDRLEYIFGKAFFDTVSLKSIEFPNSLKFIGTDAFSGSGVEKIIISENIQVSYAAFADTFNLKELVLENGVNNLESSTFASSGLEYAYIPSSFTKSVGGGIFADCENLKKVEFAEIMNEEATVFTSMFEGCRNLTDIKLSSNITAIASDAFRGCASLKEITIPASVKEIRRGAFGECYNLTDIYFESADCDGLEDSGIVGQFRIIHAPAGGSIEKFCNIHPLIKFVVR